jgi:hypothetical protein
MVHLSTPVEMLLTVKDDRVICLERCAVSKVFESGFPVRAGNAQRAGQCLGAGQAHDLALAHRKST